MLTGAFSKSHEQTHRIRTNTSESYMAELPLTDDGMVFSSGVNQIDTHDSYTYVKSMCSIQ